VRPVQHLERARARRLAGLDVIERDDRLGRTHRGVQLGLSPDRGTDERGAGRSRDERSRLARRDEHRAGALQPVVAEHTRAVVDEEERVVELVGELQRRAGCEHHPLERELGAALGRDERLSRVRAARPGVFLVGSQHACHVREHRSRTTGDDRRSHSCH
jgi:hypothetical protein